MTYLIPIIGGTISEHRAWINMHNIITDGDVIAVKIGDRSATIVRGDLAIMDDPHAANVERTAPWVRLGDPFVKTEQTIAPRQWDNRELVTAKPVGCIGVCWGHEPPDPLFTSQQWPSNPSAKAIRNLRRLRKYGVKRG